MMRKDRERQLSALIVDERETFELARLWFDTINRHTWDYGIIPIGTLATQLLWKILDYEFTINAQ